jgi:hypothetical protein
MLERAHVAPRRSHLALLRSHLAPLHSHLAPRRSHLALLRSHVAPLRSHVALCGAFSAADLRIPSYHAAEVRGRRALAQVPAATHAVGRLPPWGRLPPVALCVHCSCAACRRALTPQPERAMNSHAHFGCALLLRCLSRSLCAAAERIQRPTLSAAAVAGESRRRCGRVPARMWASPGADVGESRRGCGPTSYSAECCAASAARSVPEASAGAEHAEREAVADEVRGNQPLAQPRVALHELLRSELTDSAHRGGLCGRGWRRALYI